MNKQNKSGFYCKKCIKIPGVESVFSEGGNCPNCSEALTKQQDRETFIKNFFEAAFFDDYQIQTTPPMN